MNYLLVRQDPIEGVKLLEIFEAQYSEGKKLYPVRIDDFYMIMEKSEKFGWIKKGMVFSFPTKVIEYVIGLLDEQEAMENRS